MSILSGDCFNVFPQLHGLILCLSNRPNPMGTFINFKDSYMPDAKCLGYPLQFVPAHGSVEPRKEGENNRKRETRRLGSQHFMGCKVEIY